MEAQGSLTILVYPVAPSGPTHEYLLLRRTESRGGFWQGVTGGVEPGEALDEAAIRELDEETRLAPVQLVPVGYAYTFPARKRRSPAQASRGPFTEHVFLAVLSAKVDPTIDQTEHDAWDWFSYEDALSWLKWPENIEALKHCERLIAQGPASPPDGTVAA